MVNEINKLIENALASGENIWFPQVGTLKVYQSKAVRRSDKQLEQPHKAVVFTSENNGVSIVDLIAGAANVDNERAGQLYAEWLSASQSDGVLTVGDAGCLKDGKFKTTADFEARINPQGKTPVAVKPKFDIWLYCLAAVCCLLAIGVCLYVWVGSSNSVPQPVKPAVEKSAVTEVPAEKAEAAAVPAPAVKQDDNTILMPVSGCSYVVLGVYRVEENARKTVKQARFSADLDCKLYHYPGKTYMVVAYENDSREKCDHFRRTIAGHFEDSWVYTKR